MQRRDFLLAIPPALLSVYFLKGMDIFGASQTHGEALENTAIYQPQIKDEKMLLAQCAPWMNLNLDDLVALVPPQKGFMYVDCPNCRGGVGSITWNLSLGGKTQCRYCKVIFPNAEYPENETVQVKTPVGGTQLFKLYHDNNGKKYWFEAKRWYMQRNQLSKAAYSLAQLYAVNPVQYADAGRRAAAILEQFSIVYPQYIVAYEYPSRPKVFLTNGNKVLGNEKQLTSGADYAAKWSAWAYMDISIPLLLAYDQLASSDFLSANQRAKVENDLFGGMIRFVAEHVPFDGDAPVQQVTPLPWPEDGVALKIKHSAGIDYVLYHPDETMRSGNIEGQPVQFSGRTALIRLTGKQLHLKMAGGTQLHFGKHVLKGTSPAGQLLSVKDNQLNVQGHFDVHPGDVIIVRHGSGFTTPFHVAKVQFQDTDTLIETQEPPTLSGDAGATLKMLFFPHMELSGPHHVTADILTTTQLKI